MSFLRRLFDQRESAPAEEIEFFMGVPYHRSISKDRIEYVVKNQIHHPEIPANVDKDKLMQIMKKAGNISNVQDDMSGILSAVPIEFAYDMYVCYWLAAQNTTKMNQHLTDEKFTAARDFVAKGLKEKTLLSLREAYLVIHAAYYGDILRILRLVSGMDLAEAMNVIYAICMAVKLSLVSIDKEATYRTMTFDVLSNRIVLEEEVPKLHGKLSQQDYPLVHTVLVSKEVRMSIQTDQDQTKGLTELKNNYWTFKIAQDKSSITFMAIVDGRETENFVCSFISNNRTLAFKELKAGEAEIKNLEQLLQEKGALFAPNRFKYTRMNKMK